MAARKPTPLVDLANLDLGDLLPPTDASSPASRAPATTPPPRTDSGFVVRSRDRDIALASPSIPRPPGVPVIVATGGRPSMGPYASPSRRPLPAPAGFSITLSLTNLLVASGAFLLLTVIISYFYYR